MKESDSNLTTEILKGYSIIYVEEDGYKDHIANIILQNKYGNKIRISPHIDCMTWDKYD